VRKLTLGPPPENGHEENPHLAFSNKDAIGSIIDLKSQVPSQAFQKVRDLIPADASLHFNFHRPYRHFGSPAFSGRPPFSVSLFPLETFTISKDIISLLSPIVKQGKALEAKIKAQRERKYADQGKNEGKDRQKLPHTPREETHKRLPDKPAKIA